MRIVIDMQGAQAESHFRGVGRHALSFAQAIARNRGGHDVILALSGLFPDTIEPLRAAFDGILPQENIRVWYALGPVRALEPANTWRREAAELIREAFLASLKPDVIHISSLFGGYTDDVVSSIGRLDTITPVIVCLHDAITLVDPDQSLEQSVGCERYYLGKVDYIQAAASCFATSEFARQEWLAKFNSSGDSVVNVFAGVDPFFQPVKTQEEVAGRLRERFGLIRRFVLCVGSSGEFDNLRRITQAFAGLPAHVRGEHQLLVVGNISKGELSDLLAVAKSAGLKTDELCFADCAFDDELVQLYNMCELFVYPSCGKRVPMPVMQAMACGAPAIGADNGSLLEIIGLDSALFDPMDISSIAEKMTWILESESVRDALRAHCLRKSQRFSEFEYAQKVIAELELLVTERKSRATSLLPRGRKPRLAFVSPLPPERTGIADYSSELLPALAEYYDITVVVAQDNVDIDWDNRICEIRDVQWLRGHAAEIDRVLYQVGNSPFHQHMLPLIREIPGMVVLHDFFIGHLIAWLEHVGAAFAWVKALYVAHGYNAVRERYRDAESAKLNFPVNLDVLLHAEGVVVHSEYSKKLANQWCGNGFSADWDVIPLLRSPAGNESRACARQALGIDPEDFVVCSFGFLGTSKLNHRLIDAWLDSCLAKDPRCKLIFVGENHGGDYGGALLEKIIIRKKAIFIRITGFASQEVYRNYLAGADMAVQLRAASRGETSAAVLDSMNYGLPLVVNSNGSMAELDSEAVFMLPDDFDDVQLVEALESLWRNPERRSELGARAREIIRVRHAPAACARDYAEAIEHFHQCAKSATPALIRAIAAQENFTPNETDLQSFAKAIATTLTQRRPAKRLLLDVSATCRTDLKTGIERVARALLLALLDAPPEGYRVEPVYLSDAGGEWKYHHACRYTLGLLECPADALGDDVVAPECGDVLLGLDLSGELLIQAERAGLFDSYRNLGVAVYFTVFDLLPVQMPEVFPLGACQAHARWLSTVSKFDGVVCISKAVADDFAAWLKNEGVARKEKRSCLVSWFHLGADVASSSPSQGLPDNADLILKKLGDCPSFLMVGTIEPRKGYLQAIDAFSRLWGDGVEVNLVIVGKEGWKGLSDDSRRNIPETIDCLRNHPELGKHLFWLDGISDEYLEKVYAASTCLVAASYGEGFGLPLIEAAQHGLPVIARDIPVFREVAGEGAFYFSGQSPEDLSQSIKRWLTLRNTDSHPKPSGIHWLTWQQSAAQIKSVLLQ